MRYYLFTILLLCFVVCNRNCAAQDLYSSSENEVSNKQILTFEPKQNEVITIRVKQLEADATVTVAEGNSSSPKALSKHDIPKHNFFDEVDPSKVKGVDCFPNLNFIPFSVDHEK